MDRKQQFKNREEEIFLMAEELLLESGETDMTLDMLATRLDVAKGTLYKHFQSKDELYLNLIIRNELRMLELATIQEDFSARVSLFVWHHLQNGHRTVLLHQIEERLAASNNKLGPLFNDLYSIRKKRLRKVIEITRDYLQSIDSKISVRDYLCGCWALTHGTASLLNSTFFQRYVGDRVTLRVAILHQILEMPNVVQSPENKVIVSKSSK